MFGIVQSIDIDMHGKFTAMYRGQGRALRPVHHAVMLATMGNQIRNRTNFKSMKLRKFNQVWQARHFTVIIHDLTDHTRRA